MLSAICLFLLVVLLGGCADMQSKPASTVTKYPEKPINVIVAFSPGSGMDLTARTMERFAPKYLGQPLVVMNKPGGAGTVGWNELTGANPDGYTIGVVAIDMLLLTQYGSGKYDYPTALSPIAQVSALPMVLAVQAEQPWQTLADLIAHAKKHPGQLKFAHAGVGTFAHVLGEMLSQEAGITLDQVPFSGGSEVTSALLGGHVQLIIVNPVVVKEHVKNGTIRILANW
jgi:tripartite-type tricarboxylate transporter receptor subunit TctC